MVDLTNLLIDVENQKHWNACGGEAGTTILEAIWRKFDPSHSEEFSPAFLWIMAKKTSGKTGNVGVNPVALLNVLKTYGCCLEKTFPYTDENLSLSDVPKAALDEASKYRISNFKMIKKEEIHDYLDKGIPVLLGMNFGGGHYVAQFGYENDKELIVNSWGDKWMQGGKYWMPKDEYDKKFMYAFAITGVKWQFLKTAVKWFQGIFK